MGSTQIKFLQLHSDDDIIVALQNLKKGEKFLARNQEITLQEDIPAKHKFSVGNYQPGDLLKMYGVVVGKANTEILAGSLISVMNMLHASEEYSGKTKGYDWKKPDNSKFMHRTFNGFLREDGRVGTANYWLFIPTVFCENRNLEVIKDALENELGYTIGNKYRLRAQKLSVLIEKGYTIDDIINADLTITESDALRNNLFPNVDGIKFLIHQGGCGGTRQDSDSLGDLLAAYADHPNVAGVTILSLGCQHLQMKDLVEKIKQKGNDFSKPLVLLEQQQEGTVEELINQALKQTYIGLIQANKCVRTPVPLNKLVLGVKCGGSDGFSGISANPALGYAADLLISLGGSVLMAEFPELNGVEQELINRCIHDEDASKFISLMRNYSDQAKAVGSGFDKNPSPGNIKDGLITDAIKSAGAAKKGGTAPIAGVLDYTEQIKKPGLNLVCTPGNDVEATTGKTASGANVIVFTTGLGTPTGNPICPVIKISSNTELSKKMPDIIDLDTGPIISGEKSIEEMGEQILELCIKVASGEVIPKAVLLGQNDFIPWKRGVSL